jgi:replication initiator protein RepSA
MRTAALTEARRSAWQRAERLRSLSTTERDLIRLASDPGFARWRAQIRSTGGCEHPIYLTGHTTTVDAATGEVMRHYDTSNEPGERLAVRCRNRRATVCQPCSHQHSGDTFHLIRSGLAGGKGVPSAVAAHPRLFLTLTAPGFGAVHRATSGTDRCRPRRDGGECEHGRPLGCGQRHAPDASHVGQPLCVGCYDYPAHVLWHAMAGELWARTVRTIRRKLASAVGITQTRLNDHVRVSFAKVAEYQRRGAVHLHAVIRLDGPDGPDTAPPDWATEDLLTDVIRSGVPSVRVTTPYAPELGEYVCRWGTQLDVHPIREPNSTPVTDSGVAAYIAKYTTKSVTDSSGADRRVTSLADIEARRVTPHVRALMVACWRLGGLPELEGLRLRAWAHTLGYRGHVLTKSRAYSTTYTALRAERATWRDDGAVAGAGAAVVVDARWRFVGSGYGSQAAVEVARGVAFDAVTRRAAGRDAALSEGGRVGRGGPL